MKEMIDSEYLIALQIAWIITGWLYMVQQDADDHCDFIFVHDTFLYDILKFISLPLVFISMVINLFKEGFLSVLIYVGILILTQLLNRNILYYVYRSIFGRDGLGTLIPMLGVIPAHIYIFIVQLS